MRVFFTGGGTGGHLYPALAIARALVALDPRVRPHFIGAQRGIERDVLPGSGFPFTLLELHPMYRAAPWRNWRTLRSLVGGVQAVTRVAGREPPALVVATGGYASGATLAWARLQRIPYVMQEQNAAPGATVRLFSRWALAIYTGFPEAADALPTAARARVETTGNPIEPPPEPRPDREAARSAWGFPDHVRVVVLAFGGSQGSTALNRLVDGWVSQGLPPDVGLIWGTGKTHHAAHARHEGAAVRVRPYLSPIAEAYACADLAVTRAGAMTTAELCAWGIPMYLVPLPTAAADHQTSNAQALSAAGAATWVREREATPEGIAAWVQGLAGDRVAWDAARQAARSRAVPDASRRIATRLHALIEARVTHPASR